eukprot:CAMPEP_0202365798 /NCGR_PEP_ID=MMETSP1126-20121109/16671_1 /ASSEMBLY_ACC=CAM_ASM_000457 /TAXON_ID=3047 /ORGANISM="Dunaliella tertiolecta, Strain CCMP1320" /LENGTH=72 /DNA_ID=CAMNT_0048960731 /DNA_START=1682 /DNA_END=1903 /DNA_ORIENTATION=-
MTPTQQAPHVIPGPSKVNFLLKVFIALCNAVHSASNGAQLGQKFCIWVIGISLLVNLQSLRLEVWAQSKTCP